MNAAVVDLLNAQLASAQILLLNAKRYHWTVAGPHFRDYHLRFEELYQAVLPMIDELGERVRAIGGVPVTSPAQIIAASLVDASDPAKPLSAGEMVDEALGALEAVIAAQAAGIDASAAAGDPGTSDLLTGFIQVLQKEAWFLRSMRG
ncbi:MAG TPA: DNA starvation/stationary phase protection protein [Holophaga sp.]|nr:DNA starvation/stationary phase protection protein [Holophaga sp.]